MSMICFFLSETSEDNQIVTRLINNKTAPSAQNYQTDTSAILLNNKPMLCKRSSAPDDTSTSSSGSSSTTQTAGFTVDHINMSISTSTDDSSLSSDLSRSESMPVLSLHPAPQSEFHWEFFFNHSTFCDVP